MNVFDFQMAYSMIAMIAIMTSYATALLSATFVTWRDVKASRIWVYAQIVLTAIAITTNLTIGVATSWWLPLVATGIVVGIGYIHASHQYWEENFSSQFRVMLYGTMIVPATLYFAVQWVTKAIYRFRTA